MKKSLLIVFLFFCSVVIVEGQTAAIGDYRSAGSGDWNTPSTWQVRTGVNTWAAANVVPSSTSIVYIQVGHLITVSVADAYCNSLNLCSTTANALKMTGAFSTFIYGKIRAFTQTAPDILLNADGTYTGTSASASFTTMVVTSGTGVLKFVGPSRTIVNTGEWTSGGNGTCNAEFALDAGAIGLLSTGIKFNNIIISSGIVSAASSSLIACSNFTVRNGARIISAKTGSSAIAASSTSPSTSINIDDGGVIEFIGAGPRLDAVTLNNNGTFVYSCAANQTLITQGSASATSLSNAALNVYDSVVITGSGFVKTALSNVVINGGLILNTGSFFDMSTFILSGSLTSIVNAGTIRTQCQTNPPVPVNKTWPGTFIYNQIAGSQTIVSGSYTNLTISNSLAGSFNTYSSAGTINISGVFTPTTLASPATVVTGSTINFNNPTGGQTIPATWYNNLTVSNTSGTTTLAPSGSIKISGAFNPGNQAFVNTNSTIDFNLSTGGQTIPQFYYNNLTFSNATGGNTLVNGGTIYVAGVFNPGSSVTANTVTGNTFNYNNAGGMQTVAATYYNNLVVSNTTGFTTLASSNTIYIAGTFTPGPFAMTYTITNSTVNFNNATGGQTIPKFNFNNLTISNASGNTTFPADTVGIAGTFLPGVGTFTVPTGSTINFNTVSPTIGQNIPSFNYYNVVFTNAYATTYNNLTGNINVANSLTLAGKKGLAPTNLFTVNYAPNATFYFSGISTDTVYANSPHWPNTNSPTNVTINSVSSTLVMQQRAATDTFLIIGVQQTGNVATITTSVNHNITFPGSITIGGLSNSEYGGIFGGIFNVTAASGNTISFNVPTSTITGSISGTVLTVTSVTSGSIYVGQIITGSGIAANTTITGLLSGTGGVGTYIINTSQTVSSIPITASFPSIPFTSVIGGVARTNLTKTITGTLSFYYGGKISINHGNSIIMANGSTIYRNDSTAKITLNSGFLCIGTQATHRVNITIAKTMTSDNEFAYLATPGKYGTLRISSGATYYPKGSRTITDLDNSGILKLIDTAQSNFYINGNLLGSGTIGGSDSATLIFGGNNSGSAGILAMMPGYQRLNGLKINRTGTGATVTLANRDTIKNELSLLSGSLLDNGNVIVVQGSVYGLAGAAHVSTSSGKIIMTGTHPTTKCIRGGNYTLGNLEIDPGVGNSIYDSTTFTVSGNMTLTSGTYLFSPSTSYITTVQGNILGTGVSSGPGKIKMTGLSKTISGVTIDSLEIATGASIAAAANFNVNRGLLLSGNFADGGFMISNAGIIYGSGTHTGLGRIKMTGADKSILGNPSLATIEIGSTGSITSGFTATINGSLIMNGGNVNINSGNILLMNANSSIVRSTGALSNFGTLSFGSAATDVVSVICNGNLRSTGELPALSSPGKIDLTINGGFVDTLNNSSKTVRKLFLNSGAKLRSLFDSGTRSSYNLTVTDTCKILGSSSIDSAVYTFAGNTFSASPMVNIIGTVKFGAVNNAILTANGNLTLKSSETRTANVADVTNGVNNNSGNKILGAVIVERFISNIRNLSTNTDSTVKAWRLISMPTKHDFQNIKQAWQEGGSFNSNPKPGYGIQIVSNGSWAANGFDTVANGPSVKYYSPVDSSYHGIANTNSPFEKGKAYMVFVRGSRAKTLFNQLPDTTVIREKGTLNIGDTTFTVGTGPNQFVSLPNPFPSAIDFSQIFSNGSATNILPFIYLYDPRLQSYGAFVTIGSNGIGTPSLSYPSGVAYLQSCQGFFVRTSSAGAGTITFKEKYKIDESALTFRVNNNSNISSLKVNVLKNQNGIYNLCDGVIHVFDANGNNAVNDEDALKFNNFNDNFSIKNSGKNLSIENRNLIQQTDTFFYQNGLKAASYQLQFIPENILSTGVQAFLEDRYLHLSTPVSLTDSTGIFFSVNSDSASYAADRFMLVFNPTTTLPVVFTSVDAVAKGNNVLVSWKVANEINIANYSVEKSADGIAFASIGNRTALGNATSASYDFTDVTPITGFNYYRIKSIGIAGEIKYSKIVKVDFDTKSNALVISPNPVSANQPMFISVNNLTSGKYEVVLYDYSGRKVFSTNWEKTNDNNQLKVQLPKSLPVGEYRLCLMNDSNKICESLLIQ